MRTMKEQIRWRNTVEDSLTMDGKTLADAAGVSLSASTRRNKRRAACISARKLERFPLGLNRDSQCAGKGGVLADDSVSGMRHDQALFGGFAGACG
jgi:hypothetical protein